MARVQQAKITRSRANREGNDIRVVLHLPNVDLPPASAVLVRFACGDRRTSIPATVSAEQPGVLLDVAVPAEALQDGIWQLSYRPEGAERFVTIAARLLTSSRQPIALIPSMEDASPKRRRPQPPKDRTGPSRERSGGSPVTSLLQKGSRARRVASRVRRELRNRIR